MVLRKKVRQIVEKLNFRDSIITVGIDIHLKQWNISVFIEDRHYKTFQQEPCPKKLLEYLEKHFPGGTYQSSYEAGYFGYHPHRELESLGIKNMVINAGDVPTSDKDKRRKSDKVDAKKIAVAQVNKMTKSIYIPCEEMEADRKVLRYRTKILRKEVTANKQRLKAFLVRLGVHKQIEGYENSYWSKKIIEQIEQIDLAQTNDRYMLDELLAKYSYLKAKMSRTNRHIVMMSKEDRYAELVDRLRSIPGIGLLTAMCIITEIWDMKRFASLDKLSSFVGIVPDTSSSASREQVKGLTRRANVELRRLLIQASWVASSRCRYMAKIYQDHKKKREQKGIIKVARKILSVIRAVWLKNENYSIEKMYIV